MLDRHRSLVILCGLSEGEVMSKVEFIAQIGSDIKSIETFWLATEYQNHKKPRPYHRARNRFDRRGVGLIEDTFILPGRPFPFCSLPDCSSGRPRFRDERVASCDGS